MKKRYDVFFSPHTRNAQYYEGFGRTSELLPTFWMFLAATKPLDRQPWEICSKSQIFGVMLGMCTLNSQMRGWNSAKTKKKKVSHNLYVLHIHVLYIHVVDFLSFFLSDWVTKTFFCELWNLGNTDLAEKTHKLWHIWNRNKTA